MARRIAEFQERQQKQTEEADKTIRPGSRRSAGAMTRGSKKVEEHYPPRIAALKEKYEKDRRELDESYQQDQGDHPSSNTNRPGTN